MVPECKNAYKEIINICRQECTEGKASFLYADEKRVGLYSSYITEKMIAEKLWDLQKADNLFVDVEFDESIRLLRKLCGTLEVVKSADERHSKTKTFTPIAVSVC